MKKIFSIISSALTIVFIFLYNLFNFLILADDLTVNESTGPGFLCGLIGFVLSVVSLVFAIIELSRISRPYNIIYIRRSILTISTAVVGFIGSCFNIDNVDPEYAPYGNIVFCVFLILISIASLILISIFEKKEFEEKNPSLVVKKQKLAKQKSRNNAGNHEDTIKYLKDYKNLLDQGVISKEEFDDIKKKLLNDIS